jgi:hypothetical protein
VKLHRLFAVAFIGIAAFMGAATLIAQCFIITTATRVIDPSSIDANGGSSFQVATSLSPKWHRVFEIRSDQVADPHQSNLIITEDGKPLGPPYSYHHEIKEIGGGRYSHWGPPLGSMVIFSTSDNSDPRTNGRKYEISARPVPSSLFSGCLLLLPIFLLVLQRLVTPKLDLTVGFSIGVAVSALIVWGRFFFDQVALAPDSTAYIQWRLLVPLGYPLFLSSITAVFGTLGWAGVIQITLLIFACVFVALSVGDIVRGYAIELAVLLLLLCHIPMFWFAGWLLSEAVFIPLVLLNLAAAFSLIAQQKIRYALILAITAALIVFVRPAGYYIPMGIIFLLIAQRGRALWTLRWACLPFAVFTAATLLINAGVRGNNTPSQVGRVLFPTVAFLFESQFVTGPYQEFSPAIEEALKPHRDGYATLLDRAARVAYSANDYNSRLSAMDTALDKIPATNGRERSFKLRESLYLSFFVSTILNRPLEYANLVIDQMVEAWKTNILAAGYYGVFRYAYLAEASNLPSRIEQIQQFRLPLTGQEVRLRSDLLDAFPGQFVETFNGGYQFIRAQRWLIYLTGLVTLIAIPIAIFLRRDSVYWLSLGYCGVVIHLSILLTAATSVFIDRYAVPVDPVILVSGAIMIGGLISWSLSRIEWFDAVSIEAGFLKRIRGGLIGVQT